MRSAPSLDVASAKWVMACLMVAVLAWNVAGMAFGLSGPPFALGFGLIVLFFLALLLVVARAPHEGDPTDAGEPGEEGEPSNARPRPVRAQDGFEWRPAPDSGEMTWTIAHEWMEAEEGRCVVSTLTFELPDGVPAEVVDAATRHGLKRATAALPGRGKVKVRREVEDVRGSTSLVRVRLDVMGFGADGAWADAAAEAFARGFVARMVKKGWDTYRT